MNGLCVYYSTLLLKENNRVQPSKKKNSFRKINIDPHFSLGAPQRPWIPYPLVSSVLSEFWSPEPTPLQGWESVPCSSRPTAKGRGGLQLQTRTCRVGCTIAECPGPAGRQPWALLEREAAGSGGRRSYLVGKPHPSSISQEVRQMSSDEFFQTWMEALIGF